MTAQAFERAWPSLRNGLFRRARKYLPYEQAEAAMYQVLIRLMNRLEEIESERLSRLAFYHLRFICHQVWVKANRAGRAEVRLLSLHTDIGEREREEEATWLYQRAEETFRESQSQVEKRQLIEAILQTIEKPKDRQLLALLAAGHNLSDAARALGVSRQAVDKRIARIRRMVIDHTDRV